MAMAGSADRPVVPLLNLRPRPAIRTASDCGPENEDSAEHGEVEALRTAMRSAQPTFRWAEDNRIRLATDIPAALLQDAATISLYASDVLLTNRSGASNGSPSTSAHPSPRPDWTFSPRVNVSPRKGAQASPRSKMQYGAWYLPANKFDRATHVNMEDSRDAAGTEDMQHTALRAWHQHLRLSQQSSTIEARLKQQLQSTYGLKAYKDYMRGNNYRQSASFERLKTPTEQDIKLAAMRAERMRRGSTGAGHQNHHHRHHARWAKAAGGGRGEEAAVCGSHAHGGELAGAALVCVGGHKQHAAGAGPVPLLPLLPRPEAAWTLQELRSSMPDLDLHQDDWHMLEGMLTGRDARQSTCASAGSHHGDTVGSTSGFGAVDGSPSRQRRSGSADGAFHGALALCSQQGTQAGTAAAGTQLEITAALTGQTLPTSPKSRASKQKHTHNDCGHAETSDVKWPAQMAGHSATSHQQHSQQRQRSTGQAGSSSVAPGGNAGAPAATSSPRACAVTPRTTQVLGDMAVTYSLPHVGACSPRSPRPPRRALL